MNSLIRGYVMCDLWYWMSPLSPLMVHWNKHSGCDEKSISKLSVFRRKKKSLFPPWTFQSIVNILSYGSCHILQGCHFFTGQYDSQLSMSKQNSHARELIPGECLGKQSGRQPKDRSSCPTNYWETFSAVVAIWWIFTLKTNILTPCFNSERSIHILFPQIFLSSV